MFAELLTLATLVPSAPWYTAAECVAAADLVYAARLKEARSRAEKMTESKDADVKACGLWLSATMTEMEIALNDDDGPRWILMEKRLDAMEKFGREYEEQRFRDMVLEAELRRVRMWAERDEQTAAMRAARRAYQILEKRRRIKKASPTYFYAEAVTNLAMTHADWTVRTVLRLIGLQADDARGTKAMRILLSKPSVYRNESKIVARSFALEDGEFIAEPLHFSSDLFGQYPTNPQMVSDFAFDLGNAGRCKEVPKTLAPMTKQMDTFSKKIRAKLERAKKTCR